jgi:hypothetical protein
MITFRLTFVCHRCQKTETRGGGAPSLGLLIETAKQQVPAGWFEIGDRLYCSSHVVDVDPGTTNAPPRESPQPLGGSEPFPSPYADSLDRFRDRLRDALARIARQSRQAG